MQPTRLPLPIVVQLGFAGSRHLFDHSAHPDVDTNAFDEAVQRQFTEVMKLLPASLRLSDRQFLCGISQVAIGADTVFTRACQALAIPQRLFLPQSRDEYLEAVGSEGEPDFTPEQRNTAQDLLNSPHVIQEHVVSDAQDRRTRFEDANLEIVRVSDVLVCLVRAEDDPKPGGTRDLLARALKRGKPVLEIGVAVVDGQPVFKELWHNLDRVAPPPLPGVLSAVHIARPVAPAAIPEISEFTGPLKSFASARARARGTLFKRAALIIIGTHIVATLCAVIALQTGHESSLQTDDESAILSILLVAESILLVTGFGLHQYLHRSGTSREWALVRLVAELTRSVRATRGLHVDLAHLFTLSFPTDLYPLLHTLNVLHLRSTRAIRNQPWEPVRDDYVNVRLTGPMGQLAFYARESAMAHRRLKIARWTFLACSFTALLATLVKLIVVLSHEPNDFTTSLCGSLAIILPVLAVGALSLAAALDLEARHHAFTEMLTFLEVQARHLREATSRREFAKLVLETEARLLGETANWFSRRSYTGVA